MSVSHGSEASTYLYFVSLSSSLSTCLSSAYKRIYKHVAEPYRAHPYPDLAHTSHTRQIQIQTWSGPCTRGSIPLVHTAPTTTYTKQPRHGRELSAAPPVHNESDEGEGEGDDCDVTVVVLFARRRVAIIRVAAWPLLVRSGRRRVVDVDDGSGTGTSHAKTVPTKGGGC